MTPNKLTNTDIKTETKKKILPFIKYTIGHNLYHIKNLYNLSRCFYRAFSIPYNNQQNYFFYIILRFIFFYPLRKKTIRLQSRAAVCTRNSTHFPCDCNTHIRSYNRNSKIQNKISRKGMRETYINPTYMKYDALQQQPSMDIREHQHLVSMALKLNFSRYWNEYV